METAKGNQFSFEGLDTIDNAKQVIRVWIDDVVVRVDKVTFPRCLYQVLCSSNNVPSQLVHRLERNGSRRTNCDCFRRRGSISQRAVRSHGVKLTEGDLEC
jgi:hypothetical protein